MQSSDELRDRLTETLFQVRFGDEPHVHANERWEICQEDADALLPVVIEYIAAAEAAIAAVRKIHQREDWVDYVFCGNCDNEESAAPWPCDTIRALDQEVVRDAS